MVLFLTGVIYTDEIIDDNFYSLGEGIANVRILAENLDTGDRIETVNFSTGGYSLFLPSGTYEISFIGNLDQDPADDIVKSKVTISDVNIKLDLATDDPNLATGILASPTENNETENPVEENNVGNESETNQSTDDLSMFMDTPIYRLQNLDRPGTYLYAGEEEVRNIGRNYPQFQLEGLAFNVSETADEDLLTIYRFRNQNIAGTYLFVGEEEKK